MRVGREGVVVNIRVELRQKLARLSGLTVVEHQAPAVALEPGCGLRAVSEVATVGRVARRLVRAGVAGGQALRFAARDVDDEDVAVRRGGFNLVRVARERKLLRDGRAVVVGRVAEREGRRAEVAGREVALS